jgi:hypothetical protein
VFDTTSWFMDVHSDGDLIDVQVQLHPLLSAP